MMNENEKIDFIGPVRPPEPPIPHQTLQVSETTPPLQVMEGMVNLTVEEITAPLLEVESQDEDIPRYRDVLIQAGLLREIGETGNYEYHDESAETWIPFEEHLIQRRKSATPIHKAISDDQVITDSQQN